MARRCWSYTGKSCFINWRCCNNTCPVLFISGTRDAFGTPDELKAAHKLVNGKVTSHFIEGGRHELKGVDDEICEIVTTWVDKL